MTTAGSPLERLRAICMAYPGSEEQPFGGHTAPTWRIEGKIFAMARDADGRESVWCKAAPGAQEILIDAAPERFYRPPYVGSKGWIGAWLDTPATDWDEVAALIDESYRLVAPKRLLGQLGRGGGP